MLPDIPFLGWPQIGALLVLGQRGIEELYSTRNTKRLLAAGGTEMSADYYRLIVVAHMAWLAAVFFLLPSDAPLLIVPLFLYLALQVARYWVIASLGRYWTHRIVTLPGAPLVETGPYRYCAHPNYAITITEIGLLPMIFGGWLLGIVLAALYAPILWHKIKLEDRALAPRKALAQSSATTK
jgi:methyltransferase